MAIAALEIVAGGASVPSLSKSQGATTALTTAGSASQFAVLPRDATLLGRPPPARWSNSRSAVSSNA